MAELTRLDIIKLLAGRPSRDEAPGTRTSLRGVDLSGLDLSHFNLDRSDVSYANLSGCKLCGTSFSSAAMFGTNFDGADMRSVTLDWVESEGASFVGADLSPLPGYYRPSFLEQAQLKGADFTDANLTGAEMHDATFERAKLIRANLTDVIVTEAFFGGECDATGAITAGVDWTGFDPDDMPRGLVAVPSKSLPAASVDNLSPPVASRVDGRSTRDRQVVTAGAKPGARPARRRTKSPGR